MDVPAWLRQLGLERYEPVFRENEIDWDVLPELTDGDLQELGLPLGPRKKLLKAIAELAARAPERPTEPGPTSPASVSHEAERRQLTVIHADLVGSTEMSARLDPEEYRDAMRSYIACVTQVIESGGGVVADVAGDGALAFFGYPRANEDDAERAVRAGLALAEEVGALRPGGIQLHARVGVATGTVIVGKEHNLHGIGPHEIFGETPNLAARLQSVAPPGSVVVCDTTRRLCHHLFTCRELEPVTLKGFSVPVRASLVLSALDAEKRLEALDEGSRIPLLGREEELDLMIRRWRDAASGRGRVVLITGEPGIGKSHIMRAVGDMLSGESHTALRYFCSPHHLNSAFHPFASAIERGARIRRGDARDEKLMKVASLFPAARDPLTVPLVADLLAIPHGQEAALAELSPQARKERTFAVLLDGFDRLAAEKPVFLAFEDVHWIDPTSLELLAALVERVPKAAALVLITARPEFTAPWPDYAHVSTVQIKRLDDEQGDALIRRVAGNKPLPRPIVEQILERADGVPLFAEELTKTVLESELLRETEAGYELLGPLPALSIPKTLHASLHARLDRLEPMREIAQIGAALGREFSFALLRRVSRRDPDTLSHALGQLAAAGLIVIRGAAPDSHYFFRHALLRDAAYSSMLRRRRNELHAAIAAALTDEFPDIAATEPETIAYHLTEAGLAEEAARHWLLAGRVAARRSANLEAIAHLTRGLEQLAALENRPDLVRLELDLRFALGPCLIAAKGPASADSIENFHRARTLCSQLGDPDEYLQVMFWIATASVIRGELAEAAEAVETLTRIAEARGDRAALLNARRGAGMIALFMGRLAEAHQFCLKALDEFEMASEIQRTAAAAAGQDAGVAALAVISWALWALGSPEEALARSNAAVERADTIDHPHSRAYAYYYNAVLHALRGEHEPARHAAERCQAISAEHGFGHWAGLAGAVRSIGEARTDPATALARLDEAAEALAAYREAGYQLGVTALYVLLSRAFLAVDEPARALEIAEHGTRFAADNSEKLFQAELLRLKAEALCRRPGPADGTAAAALLDEALGIARAQSARSIELAVARSVAELDSGEGLAALRSALDGMKEGARLAEVIEAEEFYRSRAGTAQRRA